MTFSFVKSIVWPLVATRVSPASGVTSVGDGIAVVDR